MIAFIQSLEAHVFTFKEVVGYVTISSCMSGAIMFLLAAFTRIFKGENHSLDYHCATCGKRYGEHSSETSKCPSEAGGWLNTHFMP